MSHSKISVIPAIDLLDGQVVRLRQGNYDVVSHFSYDPVALAKSFELAGARRIHIVDLNGAKDGYLVNEVVIKSIRKAVDCEIELGGGIRSYTDANKLIELGINYIILGSLLIRDFDESIRIIESFKHQVIAGLDAKDDLIAVEGWKEISHISIANMAMKLDRYPLNSIIYTDIAKDGMMTGPNFSSIETLCHNSSHSIIASGGIRSLEDINMLDSYYSIGLVGCIIGKAVLDGHLTLKMIYD